MSLDLGNGIPIEQSIPSNENASNESATILDQDGKIFSNQNNFNQIISTSEQNANEIDGYLFDIYEEDNYLFLFLKVLIEESFKTICVQIEEPRYYLYFYPTEKDKKDSLVDEVREIATKCGGYLMESKKRNSFQNKFYAFDNVNVPKEGEWLCASFSRNSDLTKIPPIGQNYKFVFGVTNRLVDCFCTQNLIKGPQWVHITKLQDVEENKYTTVPTYKIKNPKRVTAITSDNKKIPNFNICSMALRYIRDSESNENRILMISLKIRDQCDIEKYKSKKMKVTFLNSEQDISSSVDDVISCDTESQLLELFFDTIEESNIDLICSYNMQIDINLIKRRMTALNIDDKCRIGRMNFAPETQAVPAHHPRGGRLFCDLRSMCDEFIKSVSSSFNYIVSQEFDNFYRQPLEQVDIVTEIKKNSKLVSLVRYNIRDTSFVDALMKKMNLLPLTLQLSQLSGCHWSKILFGAGGGGPSSRCEALFVSTFSELGFIIPEKYSQTPTTNVQVVENEEGETTRRRVPQYKGGLVLEPQTGFYDNCVLVLDFNSLYPSIIREYNLCFTTIGNEKLENDESRIELANKKTKNAPPGILPSIMANLLEMRAKVKAELAEVEKHISHVPKTKENEETKNFLLKEKRLKIQQAAIKILANAMYGYLGFPYSRFPAIHIAEMITCLGREILETTSDQITQMNHIVVYGDTDSVMIRTNTKECQKALETAEEIGKTISSQYTYLKLGVESIFMKFLLLNKKKYAALVYELSTLNNKEDEIQKHTWLKIKGLEIIRREWCQLSKYLCTFALESFMYCTDQSEASVQIINEIKRISSLLLNDGQPTAPPILLPCSALLERKLEITVDDLIITKGITKSLDQYKANDKTFNVTVGRWMEKKGYHVRANDVIPYIVIDDNAKEAEKRAKHPSKVYSVCEADIEWYLTNQLLPPLLRMCEPFQSPTPESIEKAFELIVKNPKSKTKKYYLSSSAQTTLNSIPQHRILTQLYFTCPVCNTQCLVKNLLSKSSLIHDKSFVCCPSCNSQISWKAAFNSIVNFVKEQLGKWERSFITCNCGYVSEIGRIYLNPEHVNNHGRICKRQIKTDVNNSDILRTLTSFYELFSSTKIDDNEDLAFLCENMSYYLMDLIGMHGLNRLQFKSIIPVKPFLLLSSE